jgi:outer membrane protein
MLALAPVRAHAERALSLDEAMEIAVKRTGRVAIARADARRADANVRIARSAWLPQLSGYGSYERTIESEFEGLFDFGMMGPEIPFGQKNAWRAGLSLAQEIWSFGRTGGRIGAARAGRDLADVGVRSAAARARLDAAHAYYDALLAGELLRIAEATLEQAEGALEMAKIGFKNGRTPEFDLLRADVARDNQRSVVTQRRSDRDLAVLRLKQVIGLALGESIRLTTPLGGGKMAEQRPVDAGAIAAAEGEASRRAPVRQAQAALRLQEAALEVARAERWPSLSLVSSYGVVNYPADLFPGSDDWRTNWTAGVVLSVPLFSGLRVSGQIDAAEADVSRARTELAEIRRASTVDRMAAEQDLAVAGTIWRQSERTVAQAERAHQIAEVRFRQGVSSHLDLVDSRLLLDQARAIRARTARDLYLARLRMELLADLPFEGGGGQR